MMNNALLRRDLGRWAAAAALVLGASTGLVQTALAADEAPDALVKRLSTEVLDTIKADTSIVVPLDTVPDTFFGK